MDKNPPAKLVLHKTARVALAGLDDSTCTILGECFQQFGIATVNVSLNELERFQTEKFDGCVLRLDERAEGVLSMVRNSPANFRMVIYGIVARVADALRFSRYGINAVLDDPVDRRGALRAVRATHLLILHEFRRYVRVPLVTPVVLRFEGRRANGTSVEVSGGGMSLYADKLPAGLQVEVEFALPSLPPVRVAASVRWAEEGQIGLRFDENDPGRTRAKAWIDKYLGIV